MRLNFDMKKTTVLTMILAAGTFATAQTTGQISGQVKDAKGAPIAGAILTVSSPALFAPKTVTSNDRGEYFMPLLPAGSYVIRANKQSYNSVTSPEIRVGLGGSVKQDIILRQAVVVSESVEVIASGGTAQVDKSDSKVASNYSADALTMIAAPDRSFSGALALTPGVSTAGAGTTTIRGGASNTTLFRVNGVDIKDDLQGQQVGTGAIEDLIEDVQVMLTPLNARFGRTMGGQVNVVTKSGGNDFKGSIRSTFSRSSWDARDRDNRAVDYANQLDSLSRKWDVVATGPIVKDRLWFSVGSTLTPTQNYEFSAPIFGNPNVYNRVYKTGNANIDAVTLAGPGNGYTFTRFDQGVPYTRTDTNTYYEGKLTGAITLNHQLEVYYKYDKNQLVNRDPYQGGGMVRIADFGTQGSESTTMGVAYRGTLSSFAFLEASYSRNRTDITWPVGKESATYPDAILMRITDVNSNGLFAFNNTLSPAPEIRASRSGNVNLKLFLSGAATHDIDLGVDFYMGEYGTSTKAGKNNRNFRTGGAYFNGTSYLFPTMVHPGPGVLGQSGSGLSGVAPVEEKNWGNDGTGQTLQYSLYANDAITINEHWNVMAGVRLNRNIIKNTDGKEMASTNNVEPRLEVKFDPFGTAQHVFSASAARLYSSFNTGFTSLFMSRANSVQTRHKWKGIAGQPAAGDASDPLGLYGVRFVDYATLTNEANYGPAYYYSNASLRYSVDEALRAPYAQEFAVNYTKASEAGRVRISLVHRTWHDEFAVMGDYRADNLVRVDDPSGAGLAPVMIAKTKVFNSNELKREYNALELDWSRRINSTIEWGGNFTYSRLVGNNNGGDSPAGSFRDNSASGYYSYRDFLLAKGVTEKQFNASGLLPLNQSLKGRAYLNITQPLGKGRLGYSFLVNYDSGLNYSATNTAPLGMPTITGAPYTVAEPKPLTYTRWYSDRGAYSLNDTYTVDFRLSWDVPLGIKNLTLIGDLKVNNVLNHIIWADWDRGFYAPTTGTDTLYFQDAPTFGRPQENTTAARNNNNHIGARNFGFSLGLRF